MAVLDVTGLSKSFGGVQALAGVDMSVETDRITGVIGPNGSGKTTLFNLISGAVRPTAGRVTWDGRDITGQAVHRIARLGLVRTYQQAMAFAALSVADNIRIGFEQGSARRARGERRFASPHDIGRFVGLEDVADETASALSFGNLRRLGIAVALGAEPRFLLLDEPAAGLNDGETAALTQLILSFRERDIGVCLIDHDMTLMAAVCERLVVLNFGTKIADGARDAVLHDPKVLDVYLGADL